MRIMYIMSSQAFIRLRRAMRVIARIFERARQRALPRVAAAAIAPA